MDLARLQAVATEPGAWLTSGRDAGKTHYSPLDLINQENVSRLGFAWQLETGTVRGMEATPIVVDGVMYTSGVAGRVYALDARDGKVLWRFEPQVDLQQRAQRLLRPGQSRRGRVAGQGLRGHL